MRITESQLRRIVRQEILSIRENPVASENLIETQYPTDSKFDREANISIINMTNELVSALSSIGARCSPASRGDTGRAMVAYYCDFTDKEEIGRAHV